MPDDPRIAQVGRYHPDVSWDAAEHVRAKGQIKEQCWVLAMTGYWGMCARDNEEIHRDIFEPDCPVPSGSRLQTGRGEDRRLQNRVPNPLYDPPWVEYISKTTGGWELLKGEEWGPSYLSKKTRSGEEFLTRKNSHGHLALVQRVTWVPNLVAAITQVEEVLLDRDGEAAVQKWKQLILHRCGWF